MVLCSFHRSHREICTRNRPPVSETKFLDDSWGPLPLPAPLFYCQLTVVCHHKGKTRKTMITASVSNAQGIGLWPWPSPSFPGMGIQISVFGRGQWKYASNLPCWQEERHAPEEDHLEKWLTITTKSVTEDLFTQRCSHCKSCMNDTRHFTRKDSSKLFW